MSTKPAKPVPLYKAQVEAAQKLYAGLEGWKAAERVLRGLAEDSPLQDLAFDALFLKAAAVNSLYGTRIGTSDLYKVAKHLYQRTQQMPAAVGPEWVDRVAKVQLDGKTHRLTSFTSKYFHFFIDPTGFPMYDRFSARALAAHLGLAKTTNWVGGYTEYHRLLCARLLGCGVACSFAELDHYLWLAGQHLSCAEGTPVNDEVSQLFARSKEDPGVKQMLKEMLGRLG